ncbi:MAG: Holliday junction resolvase RuvX [Oscillospiraceae bacterium]|nr:Holliday junction resolvase RuvX [Oscillospiraceae bacterium]
MKILGLDYGEARIGVSVSDALGILATPLETISEKDREKQLEKLSEVAAMQRAELLVFGLPMRMDGTLGHRAEYTEAFAKELSERTGLPYKMWDERLSSAEAHRILEEGGVSGKKRKTKVDKIAAVIILQGYLDSQSLQSPQF